MRIIASTSRLRVRQRVLPLTLLLALGMLALNAGGPALANTANWESSPNIAGAGRVALAAPAVSEDHGDAPETYGDASHTIADDVWLGGAAPDADVTSLPTQHSDGDDLDNLDDEDAVPGSLPALLTTDTSYALDVTVYNNSGGPLTLYGWLDENADGSFAATERLAAVVPSSDVSQSVSLTWTGLTGLSVGPTHIRLRLSDQADLGPSGPGGVGEVEDHPLPISCSALESGAVVTASISGTQVRLDWAPVPDALGYAIYRITDPNSYPSGRPYGAATSGTWLDTDTASVGDVTTNYYYIVRTSNGCGYGVDSNLVGEFDFAMVPGTA